MGNPEDSSSYMGSINSGVHIEKIKAMIAIAIKDGGKVLCGETVDPLLIPPPNTEVSTCLFL